MINLDPIFISDSQLFKARVYDADGVTPVTPLSCTCSVWEADTNTAVITNQAGTVGSGYAQYNWAGIATAGNYEATLTVTISAGVVKTEHFRVTVRAKPPAFTNDLSTDIGKVRMELGDDVESQGVRPDGSNLTDAQIQKLLDREGAVMPAVALACELLARQWARVSDLTLGPRRESLSQISAAWSVQAGRLREQYGGAGAGAFAVMPDREDGYSEHADEIEG